MLVLIWVVGWLVALGLVWWGSGWFLVRVLFVVVLGVVVVWGCFCGVWWCWGWCWCLGLGFCGVGCGGCGVCWCCGCWCLIWWGGWV
ncbi:hypothetical protein, partial [Pseudomonas syringae group genomosp. 7]|uniref:hypothetical protein n=1 Tax=Pseudomonas syringae group genomosp. 7 TaxID=251699 RepID=UPI00376FEFBC